MTSELTKYDQHLFGVRRLLFSVIVYLFIYHQSFFLSFPHILVIIKLVTSQAHLGLHFANILILYGKGLSKLLEFLPNLCDCLCANKKISILLKLKVMTFYFSWIHNDLQVATVGSKVDLTYEYEVSSLSGSIIFNKRGTHVHLRQLDSQHEVCSFCKKNPSY